MYPYLIAINLTALFLPLTQSLSPSLVVSLSLTCCCLRHSPSLVIPFTRSPLLLCSSTPFITPSLTHSQDVISHTLMSPLSLILSGLTPLSCLCFSLSLTPLLSQHTHTLVSLALILVLLTSCLTTLTLSLCLKRSNFHSRSVSPSVSLSLGFSHTLVVSLTCSLIHMFSLELSHSLVLISSSHTDTHLSHTPPPDSHFLLLSHTLVVSPTVSFHQLSSPSNSSPSLSHAALSARPSLTCCLSYCWSCRSLSRSLS